jgi:HD-like signal output (HDOD) protein
MEQQKITGLDGWVDFLSGVEIPVLKHTARGLQTLLQDKDKLSAREIAHVIKQDPLMTAKLLRYLQQNKRSNQDHEVVEVEQVLMMFGLEPSLRNIPAKPLAEEMLGKQKMEALICLLRVIHRSNLASSYAFDWAIHLNDLHFEEIRIAALLHDIAELLMWCFSSTEMLKVRTMQQQDKTLRSNIAQTQVLGFSLDELKSELVIKWSLPKLFITLMDDQHEKLQRVRNVSLAVNLARHSANGWDDAALPDDYSDIAALLKLDVDEVINLINAKNDKNHAENMAFI